MNKRIIELDTRAKDYAAVVLAESEQGGIARFNQLYRDKFAELIVKDCAGVYEAIDNGNEQEGTLNYIKALKRRYGL